MNTTHDVIIIGGSYAGLSAAMSLGRSLRKVLIIDGNNPCNRQTPHSHNFITQDGETPAAIAAKAKEQVLQYETVQFYEGLATEMNSENGFRVITNKADQFSAERIILATGITDQMPQIPGFAECWGISVIHCPYCHGYEQVGKPTGILANGDRAYHYAQMLNHLTDSLHIFTNGPANFTQDQLSKLRQYGIGITEEPVKSIAHENGQLSAIAFTNGASHTLEAIYSSPAFEQAAIVQQLGCTLNEHGLIQIDEQLETSVPGVYACGDNSHMRSVAIATASGSKVGALVNFSIINERF